MAGVEGIVAAPVLALCATLLEVDLFPLWMPGVEESTLLEDLSHAEAATTRAVFTLSRESAPRA